MPLGQVVRPLAAVLPEEAPEVLLTDHMAQVKANVTTKRNNGAIFLAR
jgi:hypothetical protein